MLSTSSRKVDRCDSDDSQRRADQLQINPHLAKGGENWIVETKDSFLIRGYIVHVEAPDSVEQLYYADVLDSFTILAPINN